MMEESVEEDRNSADVLRGRLSSSVEEEGESNTDVRAQLDSAKEVPLTVDPEAKMVVQLDVQRWVHPDIAAFPSLTWYGGRVRNATCVQSLKERPAIPGFDRLWMRRPRREKEDEASRWDGAR